MAGILQWLSKKLKRWTSVADQRGQGFWSDKRIATILNSQGNNIRGEVGYRIMKQKLLEEPPLDNPEDGSLVWETGDVNCSAKAVISLLWVTDLDEKVMGWLEGVSAGLPFSDLIMSHKRNGLYLWEHDSTVWVHFCLLEFDVLDDLCVEVVYMWVSGGRGAESVSFDD